MAMSVRPTASALVLLFAAPPAGAGEVVHHRTARRLVVHPRPARPAAATLGVAGDPGHVVRVPHDIGPDGAYGEYADLVKSIDGTPCGQDCARRSLQRWGFAPLD